MKHSFIKFRKLNINIKLFSFHRIKYLDVQSYNQTGIKSLNTPLKKSGLFLSLSLIIRWSHNPATVTNRFRNPNNLFLMTPVRVSLEAQMVKNLPAMCETLVWSLGGQDPLEKRMAPREENGYPPQYSCPENPKDRGAWWVQSRRLQRVWHNWTTNTHTHTTPIKTFRKKLEVCKQHCN